MISIYAYHVVICFLNFSVNLPCSLTKQFANFVSYQNDFIKDTFSFLCSVGLTIKKTPGFMLD